MAVMILDGGCTMRDGSTSTCWRELVLGLAGGLSESVSYYSTYGIIEELPCFDIQYWRTNPEA